jgi:hypothetical protein
MRREHFLMSLDFSRPHEARISAADLRRRASAVCAEMLLSFALIASICAVALIIGTNAASAAVRNLVMIDDGISGGALLAVIGIAVLLMLLAPFAFNGLTPGLVRRRRSRR